MRIKELRKQFGFTQKKLAEMLNTTQQTVGRWESGSTEPSLSSLRDMAMIFDCSVDVLIGAENIVSNVPNNALRKGALDGFWGHIGILLKNEKCTHWYPISFSEYDRVSCNIISNSRDQSSWCSFSTLSNKSILFNLSNVLKVCFLDDACDNPDDDWEIDFFDYSGHPMEIYRGLDAWHDNQLIKRDWVENTSSTYRGIIHDFIKEKNWEEDDVFLFLYGSRIFLSNGRVENHIFEPESMHALDAFIESGCEERMIQVLTIDGNIICYPYDSVSLIEFPLLELLKVSEKMRGEM